MAASEWSPMKLQQRFSTLPQW